MRPLANNLKKARKKKDLTQGQTAIGLKLNIKTYQAYEEDRAEPSLGMMAVILDFFEIREEEVYPFIYNEDFWKK